MKILQNERMAGCPWDVSHFASVPGTLQHMIRVHGRNGQPYCLIDAYFDASLYDLSPRQFEEDTVLGAIEKIRIATADSATAELLKIPVGDPVAVARRLVSDKNGKFIYIGSITYPGNRIEIDMMMDVG